MKLKHLLLYCLLIFSVSSYAQSSLKRVPKPVKKAANARILGVADNSNVVKAFRFTGPIAGYLFLPGNKNQIVTGLGYGWQRMHFVDSTQKYYTDFSISAVAYAGGNTLPSLHPNNIMSVGVSIGVLNQLIMLGPAYNLPSIGNSKGSIGLVINISMPLN